MKDSRLDARFREFLAAASWAESIDELDLTAEQANSMKADYFMDERRTVVEVKSADKEMGPEFEKALTPFMNDEDWPVFYGKANIAPFLDRHPRRDEIMPVLIAAVTKALETHIKKANKQVRSTKSSFNLPASRGLVVYLNDRTEVVAPDVVANRVAHMFQSRHADGRSRFSSLQAVLVISEAHYIDAGPVSPATPCLFVGRESLSANDPARQSADKIVSEWARHNGTPLMNMTIEELSELSRVQHPRSALDSKVVPNQMAMYQAWIREYGANRYLRPISDDDLTRLGAGVIGRLGANFLKETAYKPPQSEVLALFQVFTHFLEEMKMRGLGMQQIMIQHGELAKGLISRLSGCDLG